MKIYIATNNQHKVDEAKAVFKEFDIDVEQLAVDKIEEKNKSLKEVAEFNAKLFFDKHKKPIIVDDTGVYFLAYPNFPGNHPKLVYELLGYKGMLKLLEGEDRNAQFKTVVSFYDGDTLRTEEGILDCTVDKKVNNMEMDVLPYEKILLVGGKPLCQFSRVEKNKISHRAIAFRKIAVFLNERRENIV